MNSPTIHKTINNEESYTECIVVEPHTGVPILLKQSRDTTTQIVHIAKCTILWEKDELL